MTGTQVDEQLPLKSAIDSSNTRDEIATENQDPEIGSLSLGKRFLRPRTIVSFVVAVAIILIALSRFNLDLGAVFTQMRHANRGYLLLAFVTYYGAFSFRAARWKTLLRNADVKPADGKQLPRIPQLSIMFVLGWFANCLVPAKLGDAYRGYLLKQRSGTSFGGALGTIFAERLADMMTLGLVLVATGFLVFGRHMPADVSVWMYLAVGLAVALIVGVLIVFRFRHILRGIVPLRIRHHYISLEEGALGSFGRIPTVLLLTAIIWTTEGIRLYFVTLSVSGGVTFTAALFVALLASLLTVVPLTPAGLGFVEFGVVGILTVLGVSQQTAASIALLDRVIAYWSVIVVGAIVYLIARWVWR
jgi:uncharacterized membrane protein YbhN (UPF0104 family)